MTEAIGNSALMPLRAACVAIAFACGPNARERTGRTPLRLALRVAMLHSSNSPLGNDLHRILAKSRASQLAPKLTACLQSFGGGSRGMPWEPLTLRVTDPEKLRVALVRLAEELPSPSPDELSTAYELLLAESDRKRRGAYYTPLSIVRSILDDAMSPRTRIVCDPACGTGRFLVEAAHRLIDRTPPSQRATAIASSIFGVDLDPCAAELCAFSLWKLAGDPSRTIAEVAAGIAVGDSTLSPPGTSRPRVGFSWDATFPGVFGEGGAGGFDAIVGNPPFLGQLKTETATTRVRASRLSAWSGGILKGYADEASTFLLLSLRLARRGGHVCLVQPMSLLSASGSGPVRAELCRRATLASVWICEEHAFPGVGVHTCAPLCIVGGKGRKPIARRLGPDAGRSTESRWKPQDMAALPTWSPLLAEALGVPTPRFESRGTLADLAEATADFRDQYYGLQGCIEEAPEHEQPGPERPGLLTSGLIAPGCNLWGHRGCRIHKRAWIRPTVRLDRLPPSIAGWARLRLVPKVLIATQTRTIECFADVRGEWLPSVPIITMTPRQGVSLDELVALLSSPLLTAIAYQRHAGSALCPSALKLSAKDLLNLPAPAHRLRTRGGVQALSALSILDAYRVPAVDRRDLNCWWLKHTGSDRG